MTRLIRKPRWLAVAAAVIASAVIASTAVTATAATGPASVTAMRPACPAAGTSQLRCLVLYAPQTAVNQAITAGETGPPAEPAGWGARDIESAYRLPVWRGSDATVAVVDAFGAPNLEADLNTYRAHYGLGPCTTANGCFGKVNQEGAAAPLPAPSASWEVETTLDVSMVSAACPRCRIRVVEANDNQTADMAAAEDTAARLGAQVISNSYGSLESPQNLRYASAYDHPGHLIVSSAGDNGYFRPGMEFYPAVLPTVTAAGGTTLARAAGARGWTESAWGHGGSGCSSYVRKLPWQHDQVCPMRTTADVSAVAQNVAIYNTDKGGWLTVAGTSVSSPVIAGVYGLAGNAPWAGPAYPYRHRRALFDVTTGTNDTSTGGAACGYSYLCTAGKGYDGPTGLGSPDGTGAF